MNLSFAQLLIIRRVCLGWKTVIHENQFLFQRLFARRFPLVISQKPKHMNWQQFYLSTIQSSLSTLLNTITLDFFKGFQLHISQPLYLELHKPMDKGIRRILRRAGALHIEHNTYGIFFILLTNLSSFYNGFHSILFKGLNMVLLCLGKPI